MDKHWTRLPLLLALILGGAVATGRSAQESAEERTCAQLLPAIESLKAMLVQEAVARTAERETQRMQLVMALLTLRYRNVEALDHGQLALERHDIEKLEAAVRGWLEKTP